MNLDRLRSAELIQAHHWKAARWFSELPNDSPALKSIAADCHLINSRLNKFERRKTVDVYKLLFTSCVARETISTDETVIGVLREGLNAVFRVMCQTKGKQFDRQTDTGTTGESGQ